jgi:hypothetical protein
MLEPSNLFDKPSGLGNPFGIRARSRSGGRGMGMRSGAVRQVRAISDEASLRILHSAFNRGARAGSIVRVYSSRDASRLVAD